MADINTDTDTKEVLREALLLALKAQAKSAELWLNNFEKYRDDSAVKNGLFALGKVHGAYNVLLHFYNGEDLPDEALQIINKCAPAFEEMTSIVLAARQE